MIILHKYHLPQSSPTKTKYIFRKDFNLKLCSNRECGFLHSYTQQQADSWSSAFSRFLIDFDFGWLTMVDVDVHHLPASKQQITAPPGRPRPVTRQRTSDQLVDRQTGGETKELNSQHISHLPACDHPNNSCWSFLHDKCALVCSYSDHHAESLWTSFMLTP